MKSGTRCQVGSSYYYVSPLPTMQKVTLMSASLEGEHQLHRMEAEYPPLRFRATVHRSLRIFVRPLLARLVEPS